MKSKIEGREYQIFISKPMVEPPPSGYPVIYVLDANSVFGTIVEAIRLQSKRSEKRESFLQLLLVLVTLLMPLFI